MMLELAFITVLGIADAGDQFEDTAIFGNRSVSRTVVRDRAGFGARLAVRANVSINRVQVNRSVVVQRQVVVQQAVVHYPVVRQVVVQQAVYYPQVAVRAVHYAAPAYYAAPSHCGSAQAFAAPCQGGGDGGTQRALQELTETVRALSAQVQMMQRAPKQ